MYRSGLVSLLIKGMLPLNPLLSLRIGWSEEGGSLSPARNILKISKHHDIHKIKNINSTSAYSHGLLNSQINLELFTAYYKYCIPQLFLLVFLVSLFFCLSGYFHLFSCDLRQLLVIVVSKCPGQSLFAVNSYQLCHIGMSPASEGF